MAQWVPRKPIKWNCEYCAAVNHDSATCHNCGAPCTESDTVDELRNLGRPFPPSE